MIGVFPGTFNPPTVAHLAVAEAARDEHDLERIDLVVSRVPLAKEAVERPTLDERLAVLEEVAAGVGWLRVTVSDAQLIADLAEGYDVVIMGADKWHQIHDIAFYDHSPSARDDAVARLPRIAVFPRGGYDVPLDLVLGLDPVHLDVSSTRARAGELDLMLPEARDSGLWTP